MANDRSGLHRMTCKVKGQCYKLQTKLGKKFICHKVCTHYKVR